MPKYRFVEIILEYLWLLLNFIMHLEAWKTYGNLGLLATGIKYLEKKSTKDKREELQHMKRFKKVLFFYVNINYFMNTGLYVCMCLHSLGPTQKIEGQEI